MLTGKPADRQMFRPLLPYSLQFVYEELLGCISRQVHCWRSALVAFKGGRPCWGDGKHFKHHFSFCFERIAATYARNSTVVRCTVESFGQSYPL
ncbi:hypothetical protein VTN02DRAFT_3344 [Thermoascus thermophilus]